ncbi:MAG TPA: PrsW family glutamic-type intramembrane protease [Vicinamibacteria bacterium]|nr:PrsW family glutamic-type intramembrane protease [Vicinamibacteria bacterium]
MTLYVALLACGFLAALLVYRYDLYNREPSYMLLLTAGLGALAMKVGGSVELLALTRLGIDDRVGLAAVAALVEECVRFVLVGLIAFSSRHFDDPMDGLVYGSVAGLGMGLEESFYLLDLAREPNILSLPVELVRLLGHVVLGGIACFGLGLWRVRSEGYRSTAIRTFLVAVGLHLLWDWVALGAEDAMLAPWLAAAAVAIMLAGLLYYGRLVVEGSERSRRVFSRLPVKKLWGWPFDVLFDPRGSRSS